MKISLKELSCMGFHSTLMNKLLLRSFKEIGALGKKRIIQHRRIWSPQMDILLDACATGSAKPVTSFSALASQGLPKEPSPDGR